MDILFDTEKGRFSYRAAGLAVKEGRLLVQRMRGTRGLPYPGAMRPLARPRRSPCAGNFGKSWS